MMTLENASARPDPMEWLEKTGALKRGHFKLTSGRHSDTYVQCALLLKDSTAAVESGEALAGKVPGGADLVLSPALGALIIGFTTALALGCDMIFAERVDGSMVLRRGFEIPSGARVLVVEDVITTGGSALELAGMAEEAGASVAGIACVVERGRIEGCRYPVHSLVSIDAASYEPADCPLCRDGVPLDSPGSRYLA